MSSLDARSVLLTAALFVMWGASPVSAETTPEAERTTGEVLELRAALSNGYLPVEKSAQLNARIQVEAQSTDTEDRAPLNLAVVVDRSGSMNGDRLAQAKRAAHVLVDRLSPRDRLAVVEYGSSVQVAAGSRKVTPNHQDRLHAAISKLGTDGRTNLEGGYEKGASIVREHATESTVDRVLLLSDGQANIGAQTPGALGTLAKSALEHGTSTTTMGIGLDYDEQIMTAMAEKGAGNHYFVEDEQRLAAMFTQEFEHLSTVVARDAYLVLELADGVELLDVHGFSHRRSGGNVVVDLGAFYGEQQRDVLVDLAASSGGEGDRGVLDVNLHFDDVTGETDRSVSHRAALRAVGTSDADKLARTDDWVAKRVEQVTYARNIERAAEAYDRGDRDEANEIIEEQKDRLDQAADASLFSESKVQAKKRELEEKESTMGNSSASDDSGKRLKKESAGEALDLKRKSSAF